MKRILAVLLLVVSMVACAVPTDDNPAVITQDRLPEALRSSNPTPTQAVVEGRVRNVEYYLLSPGDEDRRTTVALVERAIPYTEILKEILDPLFQDDFAADIEDLSNQVTAYGLDAVEREGDSDVVTVRLTLEGEVPNTVLTDVAAQLVWTLTELETVDAILVTINGDPVDLPTNEGNKSEPVRRADYIRYDPAFVAPDATTTTTTTGDN